MVGHTFVYNPAVVNVRERIVRGDLGKIYYVDSQRVNLGLHQFDINVLWDLGPHDVSITLYWLDEEPEWVQSVGACYTQSDIEDVVFLTMGFPSGAVAHAHLSWLAPSKLRSMVVIGSHRMAVYDDVQSIEKVKIYDHGVTELSSEELRRSYRSGDIRSPHIAGTEALQMEASEHFHHWLQNLADETGFTGDHNHVDMKVDWARELGVSDEELLTYRPMAETVGAVYTTLYYMRRSYEEGLAAFGWAGERFAASTNYALMMYEGMRDHYGIEVENFRVHAYAEADHGDAADYLLRQVVVTAGHQRRVRRTVEHVLLCRNARTAALNRWLDEPGALRR